MLAVVTPAEMGEIDAAAPEPTETLIDRAGAAVARAALRLLGGAYGRRVVVVAGKGNNGNDGRAAAERLARRGVRVTIVAATDLGDALPPADLVIDAAFGTGFRGEWSPPPVGHDTPVLAVDIPSGLDGRTGVASGRPWTATATVTFAAHKPGLLLGDGPATAGTVEVADIGLDVSRAPAQLVTDADVAAWVPQRPADAHKWHAATWIVAGSPTMTGAAHLATAAAQRAGAGYVRLSTPGLDDDPGRPTEAVGAPLAAEGWARPVLDGLDRFASLATGPGLGTGDATAEAVRRLARAPVPLILDGDALTVLGHGAATVLAERPAATVCTPHDGEFTRLGGDGDEPDRIAATGALAARLGAVVLRKGSTTIVAHPDGDVFLVTAGDARLATAGTGDVLTGVIAALIARRTPTLQAAAAGVHLHGTAGSLARRRGLIARDIIDHLPAAVDRILGEGTPTDHATARPG